MSITVNELAETLFANKEWRDDQNIRAAKGRNLTVKEMWECALEDAARCLGVRNETLN